MLLCVPTTVRVHLSDHLVPTQCNKKKGKWEQIPSDKAKLVGSFYQIQWQHNHILTRYVWFFLQKVWVQKSGLGLEILATGMTTSIFSVQAWVTDKCSSDAEESHCKVIVNFVPILWTIVCLKTRGVHWSTLVFHRVVHYLFPGTSFLFSNCGHVSFLFDLRATNLFVFKF